MLQLALLFHEKGLYESYVPGVRRKPKIYGYQISKTNYRILNLLVKAQVTDIPRSRIVEYHYIQVDDRVQKQGNYFILPVTEDQLPRIEAITTTEHRPRVYLWRDEQWWSFPQLETYKTGEMATFTTTMSDIFGNVHDVRESQIEKTGIRIRASYEPTSGPGFALTTAGTQAERAAPADLPTTITGNGMVLEWKRGYADKQPAWWLRDEQRVSKAQSATYRHYAILKATPHARWSKSFGAWYYTGGAIPPQKWLELVGYQPSVPMMPSELTHEQTVTNPNPIMPAQLDIPTDAECQQKSFAARHQAFMAEMDRKRQLTSDMQAYHAFHAGCQLYQRFTELAHHLQQHLALPMIATPSLDDPWG